MDTPPPSADRRGRALEARIREHPPQHIREQERAIHEIFVRQHDLTKPGLLYDLGLVRSILAGFADAGKQPIDARARELASYVTRASQALRLDLIEHAGVAARTFPQRTDVSALEARELTYRYLAACEQAERELRALETTARGIASANGAPHGTRPSELMIRARDRDVRTKLARVLQQYGTVERLRFIPYLALRTDEAHARTLLQDARSVLEGGWARETVIYAARTYHVAPIRTPGRSTYAGSLGTEWNLDLVGAPAAWDRTRGAGAAVAVIDTGVDYTHPDLKSRFGELLGVNIVDGGEPYDDNGHGTHVAGTVAGSRTGVAPDATLYAVKVLNSDGFGSEITVLKGIEWAIEHSVDVINMSLGSSSPSDAEADLIAIAKEHGIGVCCAAGNDGDGSYNYPASYPGAISVAAVDERKQHADFSNYNDRVSLCAPGVGVYSTWPGGGYDVLSGTSMATPHIAGACALLKSAGKLDYVDRLSATAEKLGKRDLFGAGLIRLGEAVK